MAAALVLFVVTDFEIFKQYQGISRLKDEFVSTVSHELRR